MKLRTTLALLLLVGSGVALYLVGARLPFVPWNTPTQPSSARGSSREILARLTPDRLVSVVVRREGEPLAVFDRTYSGRWMTTGNWPGNPADIQPIIDLLGSLNSRFVTESSTRLEHATLVVEVLTREDLGQAAASLVGGILGEQSLGGLSGWVAQRQVRSYRLLLGEATGESRRFVRPTYLRVDGQDEVLQLAPGLVGELSRPADHYRLRRIFPAERTVRLNNPQERIERLDARELRIEEEGKPPIRLVKGADGWQLAAPSRDHLDPDVGERLLSAIAELWAERFIHIEPPVAALAFVPPSHPLVSATGLAGLSSSIAFSRTGLDRSTQSLHVVRPDGTTTALHFGNRSRGDAPPPLPPRPSMPPPTVDSYRYARLAGSDVIFEVQDGRLNDIFVAFETLRDNRLTRFNADDAEELEIRQGGQTAKLVKEKKDSWKMIAPRDTSADNDKVKDLLQKLSTLDANDRDLLSPARQTSLAAGAMATLASPSWSGAMLAVIQTYPGSFLGVDQPGSEVIVQLREKARPDDLDRSKKRTISLRSRKIGNRVYLQTAGWPRIDAMDDSLSALLDSPAMSYRGKQVFDFAAQDINRLEIRSVANEAIRSGLGALAGAGTVASDRGVHVVLVRAGDQWNLTTPVSTVADGTKVSDLLDTLGKFKVLTFVADDVPAADLQKQYGVATPLLRVTVSFSDQAKPAKSLLIGAARVLEQGSFARLDGSRDVFAIPGDLRSKLEQPGLAYMPSTLWQIAADDEIVRYRIAKSGQDEYQLSRMGDTWQVTGPFSVAAPSEVVERLSVALMSPKVEEYRTFAGGDLATYGLTSPAVQVTLTTRKGTVHSLSLGATAATGKRGRFARQGTGASVFVVSDALAKALDQSALDFLDRGLLMFDSQAVTTLVRQQGADLLELTRQDDNWKLTKPSEQPADDRKVPDLLRQLSALRADRILAYKPKDLKPFGLEKPSATVTITLGGGEKRVLLVGRAEGAGERVVQVEGQPTVGVLSAGVVKQLLGSALNFRSHDLARVPDADTMKLEAGERKITFARPEGTWKVTQPITVDADHDALEGYFNALSRLRADELVAEKPSAEQLKTFGFDKPTARWQIFNGEDLKLDLTIGAAAPGGRRYGRLAENPVVFLLDEKVSGLVVGEYRPRAMWKETIDPAQIETVKFAFLKDGFELKKVDGDWQVAGKPAMKLNAATVSDTLSALRELKLERYVKDDGAQLKLFGLDPPELVLEATTPTGKYTLHLGGLEGGSRRRYARLPLSKWKDVFVLDEAASNKLMRNLDALMKPTAGEGKPSEF